MHPTSLPNIKLFFTFILLSCVSVGYGAEETMEPWSQRGWDYQLEGFAKKYPFDQKQTTEYYMQEAQRRFGQGITTEDSYLFGNRTGKHELTVRNMTILHVNALEKRIIGIGPFTESPPIIHDTLANDTSLQQLQPFMLIHCSYNDNNYYQTNFYPLVMFPTISNEAQHEPQLFFLFRNFLLNNQENLLWSDTFPFLVSKCLTPYISNYIAQRSNKENSHHGCSRLKSDQITITPTSPSASLPSSYVMYGGVPALFIGTIIMYKFLQPGTHKKLKSRRHNRRSRYKKPVSRKL